MYKSSPVLTSLMLSLNLNSEKGYLMSFIKHVSTIPKVWPCTFAFKLLMIAQLIVFYKKHTVLLIQRLNETALPSVLQIVKSHKKYTWQNLSKKTEKNVQRSRFLDLLSIFDFGWFWKKWTLFHEWGCR